MCESSFSTRTLKNFDGREGREEEKGREVEGSGSVYTCWVGNSPGVPGLHPRLSYGKLESLRL